MKILRHSNVWLRHRSILAARRKYPDLFPDDFQHHRSEFIKHLKSRQSWWFVIISVVGFLAIGWFGLFDWIYSFTESRTPIVIIDSRAQNIATIISVTLVVIGFIFSNLAVKESVVYQILFRNSWLYPILYFSLTTLGSIFLISMCRDNIPPVRFQRLVVAITFLAILVLIFIGWLFQTITQYTNASDISKKIQNEFISETIEYERLLKIKHFSEQIFLKEMEKLQVKEYNFFMHLNLVNNLNVQPPEDISFDDFSEPLNEYLILDVNLRKLKCWVRWKRKSSKAEVYFNKLFVGMTTNDRENYLIQDGAVNTDGNRQSLREALKCRQVNDNDNTLGPLRTHFDQTFDVYVDSKEQARLKLVLDAYYNIYELKMKYQ